MANDKDFIVKNAVEVGKDTKVTLGTISSSAINLSTGNYFNDTLTANTTYTINNAGAVQSFQLEVTGVTLYTNNWDVSAASYSQNFSVASQETNPTGIFFKPDGTEMYIIGIAGDDVNQYTLSTAWDISTASYTRNFSVASEDLGPTGVFFKTDGTKMYVAGLVGTDINEYTLSTAWNISTASYSQNLSVSTPDGGIEGMYFRTDGLKMYYAGRYSDGIYEYTLSTAWDISTASYIQNHSVSSQDGNIRGVFFKSDGTKMYVVGDDGNDVNEYTLSTAWDVSTASYSQNFSVSSQDTEPQDIFFKPEGDKMYIVGDVGNDINEYTVGSFADATITWPSSIEWGSGTAPSAPAGGETDLFSFSTDDGGTTYHGFKTADNLS